MFTWQHLMKALASQGYEGPQDDLSAVKSFLSAEGMDTEKVEAGEKTFSIDDLFRNRAGKPLDVSKAVDDAEFERRVSEQVEQRLDAFSKATGFKCDGETDGKAAVHDVKVGKMRLVDDPKGGFKHAGEFYAAVVKAGTRDVGAPQELEQWQKASLSTYGSEGVGADGGFAVPAEFRETITSLVESNESLMGRCDQLPISTASISLPDDETTPWGSSGIRAYWENESGAYTQSKPSLKSKDFRLRKLTTLVPLTEELLEDAVALGSYVEQNAPDRINWEVDEAIVRGTGAGQPLGFLSSGAVIEVAKEGSQTDNTISGPNVIKMYSRMFSRYRGDAIWIVSHDAESELLKLSHTGTDASGDEATGWGFRLYSPPGQTVNGATYGTLMGRPVLVSEHADELGQVGDIMLVSMSQYRCVMRAGGIQAAQSMHLWFDQDAVAMKFRMRVDGAPKLSTTISPRSGSNTLSAFVTLAARTS
jgi:HK97 family phage major capsid protein